MKFLMIISIAAYPCIKMPRYLKNSLLTSVPLYCALNAGDSEGLMAVTNQNIQSTL